MKIGFIGLGNMGAPMARNLIKAGHELLGFDVAPTNVGDITQDSITKIAEQCRIIISMLPDGNILRNVYEKLIPCLLYTSPSPRDISGSRMPSSA